MTDADSGNESRLGAVLRQLDVTQSRFAELAERDTGEVSRWVTGVYEPRRRNKATIIRTLRDLGWVGTSDDLWPVDDCQAAS